MPEIEVKKVEEKKSFEDFLKFPWKIYENDPNWVAPILRHRRKFLSSKKNPFFKHADVDLYVAYKDGEPVGTIAAFVDHTYNEYWKENVAHFGFFETIDDLEVAKALFEKAEEFAKKNNKDALRGPFNFSTNHTCGLLIDGFNEPPVVEMTYNPEYYVKFIDDLGFEKYMDLLAYHIEAHDPPEGLVKAVEKVKKRAEINVRTFSVLHFFRDDKITKDIYNDAWSKNCCFVPMDDEEYQFVSDHTLFYADPKLVRIGSVNGEDVGFTVALPDLNQYLIKFRSGKLPFSAIAKIYLSKLGLTKIKEIDTIRVYTLGIKHAHQDVGLGAVLYLDVWQNGMNLGYKAAEMSWILENNEPMNWAIQALGGKVYKTYRLYTKNLK